ncbi:MAG: PilT/PilU family type 4a pilus ATPase [Candidatus Riflebacteria bacterium]|nr:PilT/PilU family type 4a pilus ATPase [Candidatus Riflebacteria bacterium]
MDDKLFDILRLAKEMSASDVHLRPNSPPVMRVGENLVVSSIPSLTSEKIDEITQSIMAPAVLKNFYTKKEADFSISLPGISRFRVNCYYQSGGVSFVFRQVPMSVPTSEDVQLLPKMLDVLNYDSGLVLVSGATGSGKSTTIAAMLDWLNKNDSRRIITLEDPIEFLYRDKKCDFVQREFGNDFFSFPEALAAAMREDPDVILVGEMREIQTIELALTAAETGHLVFSTVHSASSASAVGRVLSVFPGDLRQFVQEQLATVLVCIIAQVLVPTKADKRKQVAAREVLFNTPAIANLIRTGKHEQVHNFLKTGRESGMNILNDSLEKLIKSGLVDVEDAVAKSYDPNELLERSISINN